MLSIIPATELNFKAYRQNFTDTEFQQRIGESLACEKENIFNSKKTNKYINKATKNLEKYRQVFKNSKFEPTVTLSLSDKMLVGKVKYLNSTPVEISSELPCNTKAFLKKIKKSGLLQVQEDTLNLEFWNLQKELQETEARQKARYKALCSNHENPILVAFDSCYSQLSEKILKLTQSLSEISSNLEIIRTKLKKYQFKIKTR